MPWLEKVAGRPLVRSTRAKALIVRSFALLGALVAWEVAARAHWIDPFFVSTPSAVLRAMVDLGADPVARNALQETGLVLGAAFVIGTAAGILVGVALGLSKLLREAYLKPVLFLLSTPKSVFLPIIIILLGIGNVSSAAFGAFSAFFYVVVNVIGGVGLVEERHRRVAKAFRAGRWQTFTEVIAPAALPGLFAALWHGVKHAFVGVMIAELFASTEGIGYLIRVYTTNFDTAHLLAVVLLVSLAAIAAGSLWNQVEARMTRWRGSGHGTSLQEAGA